MDKNTIVSFLDCYGLINVSTEPISSGLSSFAFMVTFENKKYVLKIYDKNSNIETEVQFGNYFYDKDIPTAEIIKNSKGQLVTKIGDLNGVLFEFCNGEPIKWSDINSTFSENLAEIVAKMHSLMLNNTKIPGKDYSASKIDSIDGLSNAKIIQKRKEINDAIKNLDFSNLRRGLIHSDLTRQNVLVTRDRKKVDAIIDFGDAHYDYFVWDLSVLITHILITKTYGIDWKALSVFIKKYYSLFPLTELEIDVIIPFIKIRNINLAIEVNRSSSNKQKNIEELKSIENSVMTKLDIVEKDQKRLMDLLKNHLD